MITVNINDANIIQDGLSLAITSTNSDRPGEVVRYQKTYPTTMTALEIKTQIETDLTLLWLATSVKTWEY